ncbi:E3 ubiquitin-protein ligase rad18 [Mortierella alpina]|uniref:Postreplication repair E3 ubiquitin-protein ligase RAD18 n=1 Tax=Mortierella alpina TaxID=64518 RepID=A0A9P6JCV7_MORAP|nr:E3 ubiquitin-protein ligase rad18 [Mortierella alpina]
MNDISDPSDWPAEYAPLKDIDSHLRCPICKELLRAAVMLQCHHNFCSECIRRHLDKESTCPACRVATSTSQMRRNVALDEIANSFKDCRESLLLTVKDAVQRKYSKQKAATRADSVEADDHYSRQQKRRRTSTRIVRASSNQGGSQDVNEDYDIPQLKQDDDEDEDFVMHSQGSAAAVQKGKNVPRSTSGPVLRSRASRSQSGSTSSQDSPPVPAPVEPSPSTASAQQPPSDLGTAPTPPTQPQPPSVQPKHSLVPCPVCSMAIPEPYSNTHLDKYCLAGTKDPAYSIPYDMIMEQTAPVIALIPKLTYSVLNDKQLRKKLQVCGLRASDHGVKLGSRIVRLTASISCAFQELGLPSHGDKQQMMKRHAEYVTIFNANCDASRPRPVSELMKAMDAWERAYELDITAKEEAKQAQRRVQDQEQWRRKQEMAQQAKEAALSATLHTGVMPSTENSPIPSNTPPTSHPSSQSAPSSSSTFVPAQANNNDVAVAVASATAFAHAAKYADEYAELMADVRRRLDEDKAKTATENSKKSPVP